MPNLLDATGLQTITQAELLAYLTSQYELIYGTDINLDSDTPDGQWMNIQIQLIEDQADLLTQIYNSFDPDNAVGVVLDQRCAINGVQRQGGTFTTTDITLVNSASVSLFGLDQEDFPNPQPIYTISDSAGNLWQLQTTQAGLSSGTHTLVFQAAVPGAQLTVPNTITVPVTIVLGVTSVNNPTTYLTLGEDEETDAVFKVRRQQSVSLASQGYLAGLLAALENINGVSSAFVFENDTDSTNADGVPSHSIWVIVAGSGTSADIANAIYVKRNAGCGMYGQTSFVITQVDGTPFTVYWDVAISQDVFLSLRVGPLVDGTLPDFAAISAYLVANLHPAVNGEINVTEVGTMVQIADPNAFLFTTTLGIGNGLTQTLTLSGVAASGTFVVNYNGHASAAINWNDSIATIQTKVRAITGLTLANVTGSIASESLVFDLTQIGGVVALLYTTSNSLATSVPAAITITSDEGTFGGVLYPSSKKQQFSVSAPNIILLPMHLEPQGASVKSAATETFTGLGGYGTLTYSLQANNSGASINGSTGVYTAGATPNVVDTVQVTDVFGNTAFTNVTVTT